LVGSARNTIRLPARADAFAAVARARCNVEGTPGSDELRFPNYLLATLSCSVGHVVRSRPRPQAEPEWRPTALLHVAVLPPAEQAIGVAVAVVVFHVAADFVCAAMGRLAEAACPVMFPFTAGRSLQGLVKVPPGGVCPTRSSSHVEQTRGRGIVSSESRPFFLCGCVCDIPKYPVISLDTLDYSSSSIL
jgi:hypothetical protein